MAKLSGVKAVSETIEYNGDVYERTEEKAQVGDIIRLGDEGSAYLTDGGYYEVVAVDWGGDAQIFDDDGDGFDTYDLDEEFTVFRKKEEPTAQYREVKRHAKVGERIRIVNKPDYEDRYENGAEFTVSEYHCDGDVVVTDGSRMMCVLYNEYVVLEPVSERLKVGDYAKVVVFPTSHNSAIPKGEIVRIVKDDWSDVPFRVESVVTGKQRWVRESDIVRATDEEVAVAKDPRSKFAVGDKVRLISGGDEYPLNGYSNGEIYTVVNIKSSRCGDSRIEITGGLIRDGYALPDQIEKVSAEEVAEYERKKKWAVIGRKPNEYKAGDLVRVTRGFAGIKAGDIAEVVSPDGSSSPYVSAGGEEWFCTVELVCPVEKRFDK